MRKKRTTGVAVAYAKNQTSGRAHYVKVTSDSVRIRHRELLASIQGQTTFTIDPNTGTFPINPGLVSTFPWLAVQAAAWEKYRFHSLKFCYYPKCGSNQQGSVMLGCDYDAADSPPTLETQLSSYYGTQEDAPWKEICFNADLKRVRDARYIRTSMPTGQDIKTFDAGTFYLATLDAGTAAPFGKLWIEYDVELMIPQQSPAAQVGAYTSSTSTLTNLFPVITVPAISSRQYQISINGDPTTANQLDISGLIPGKYYKMVVEIAGTALAGLSDLFLGTTPVVQQNSTLYSASLIDGVISIYFEAVLASAQFALLTGTTAAIATANAYIVQRQNGIVP
jgi:hypothetical protein